MTYDAIVVGLGVAGASACWRLAQRGVSVLGVDRFRPPHPFGSSHGRTRIIREAYFEGEGYLPLLRDAYDGWAELEAASGRTLYRCTGGLTIGPADGATAARARGSAERHGVAVDLFDAVELRKAFPAFHVHDHEIGVFERRAGVLSVEPAIGALLDQAHAAGAELRFGVEVSAWREDAGVVRVATRAGDIVADTLVLAAGPWLPQLAAAPVPLEVERSVVAWFEPAALEPIDSTTLPVFIHEHAPGEVWYGVPEEGALKVGLHHGGQRGGIDSLRRGVDPAEIVALGALVARVLPGAAGPVRATSVCPYTNTPDGDFLVDHHPDTSRVVLVSACSGHGFKFGPVLGAAAADLALGEKLPPTWRPFAWRW